MSDKLYYDTKTKNYVLIEQMRNANSPRLKVNAETFFITFSDDYSSPDRSPYKTWDDMLNSFGQVKRNENDFENNTDLSHLREVALEKDIYLLPVWQLGYYPIAQETQPFPVLGEKNPVCGVIFQEIKNNNIEELRRKFIKEVNDFALWKQGMVFDVSLYDKSGEMIECVSDLYGTFQTKDLFVKNIQGIDPQSLELISEKDKIFINTEIALHQENLNNSQEKDRI